MNKKGMSVLAGVLLAGIVFLVLAGAIWFGVSQATTGDGVTSVTNNCETSPYITLSGLNASTKSQTVIPTYNHRLNDVYRGALTSGSSGTTFSIGDKVVILATLSGYRDIVLPEVTILKCASTDVSFEMDYDASGGTLRVFNSDNLVLQDAELGLTGNNQSSISSGTSKTIRIELTSAGKQSIDPTWISLELTNKSNVKNFVWGGQDGVVADDTVTIPDFHSDENTTTSSYVEFARISGLKGNGIVNEIKVTIEASSTGSYNIDATSGFVNSYLEQAFVDVDGTFVASGQIEDADNTVKYSVKGTDYDFHIT